MGISYNNYQLNLLMLRAMTISLQIGFMGA